MVETGNGGTDKPVVNPDDGTVKFRGKDFNSLEDFALKTQKSYDDERNELNRRQARINELEAEKAITQPLVDQILAGDLSIGNKDKGNGDRGSEKGGEESIKNLIVEGDEETTTKNITEYVKSQVDLAIKETIKPFEESRIRDKQEIETAQAKKWLVEVKEKVPELKEKENLAPVLEIVGVTNWPKWFEQNPELAKLYNHNPIWAAYGEGKNAADRAKAEMEKKGYSEGAGEGGSSSVRKMSDAEFFNLSAEDQDRVLEKELKTNFEKVGKG